MIVRLLFLVGMSKYAINRDQVINLWSSLFFKHTFVLGDIGKTRYFLHL